MAHEVKCPNPECGKVLSVPDGMAGQKATCPKCGREVPVTAAVPTQCPNCQKPIEPGAVLCVQCGFNLKTGKVVTASADERLNAKETAKNFAVELASSFVGFVVRFRYFIIGFIIIATIITILGRKFTKTSQQVEDAVGQAAQKALESAPKELLDQITK